MAKANFNSPLASRSTHDLGYQFIGSSDFGRITPFFSRVVKRPARLHGSKVHDVSVRSPRSPLGRRLRDVSVRSLLLFRAAHL